MAYNGYFAKFPNTTYNNVTCTNIMRRAAIDVQIKNDPTLFYRYQIKENVREDQIAQNYYDDSYFAWLIYLANGIIDPFFQWYLTPEQFEDFIIDKFGDYLTSTSRIAYYQINWPSDDATITVGDWDNNLTGEVKKYYDPVFGQGDTIIAYERRQDDTIVDTNMIVKFNMTISSGNGFANSELINIMSSGVTVGQVEFVSGNSTVILVKNVSGNTDPANILYGQNSSTNSTITQTTVVYRNIPADEFAFWTPVSWFDHYNDINEKNKNILLIRSTLAANVSSELTRTLNS